MQGLFESLSHAIEGAPAVALFAALAWGVLSILLSPCHLASIPLIVGFIADQEDMRPRKAFWTASAFSLGILATIAAIGAATAAAGRMMGDLGPWANYGVSVVFFAVGFHLVGVFELPLPAATASSGKRRGLAAAFMLGAVFGIALGPCTFAYMAPVLAASLRIAAAAPVYAGLLVLAYGIGHCAVIVGAGASAQATQDVLNWNARSTGATVVKRVCGVLVLAGGVYLLYTA